MGSVRSQSGNRPAVETWVLQNPAGLLSHLGWCRRDHHVERTAGTKSSYHEFKLRAGPSVWLGRWM